MVSAMLDPANRSALTAELAPPRGYRLGQAVGTTFTLDLHAALAVPLAFAGFEQAEEDHSRSDEQRTSVIAALLSVTEKIDIFAQAGALRAERTSKLLELLGPVIHQVAPGPHGTIFHPKIWFLEFENDLGHRRFRLLCSSRNLTFDRTWDAMIRLDGILGDSQQADIRNEPLVAFLHYLSSDQALTGTLPSSRRRRLLNFAQRLSAVEWETPADVKELRFQVFGVPGIQAPEPGLDGRETLIVSPFLTPEGVARLAAPSRRVGRGEIHLVSRPESFDAIGSAALEGIDTWIINPAAQESESGEGSGLSGLHAKLVAVSTGKRGRVLIGSANATGPGWNGNVELMVDAESTQKQFRPDRLLDSMKEILEPYTPQTLEPEDEPQMDELERLQRAALIVASVPMTVRVSGDEPYHLTVSALPAPLPGVVRRVTWHLLPDPSLGAEGLPSTAPVRFAEVPLTRISPFIRVTVEDDAGQQASTIALAALQDDPPQRREAIIASRLANPQKLLQLIMLLLEFSGAGAKLQGLEELGADSEGRWESRGPQFPGMLEALLRALDAGPEGMAEVQRILSFIRCSPEGAKLPDDFMQLWDAAWAAHTQENLGAGS